VLVTVGLRAENRHRLHLHDPADASGRIASCTMSWPGIGQLSGVTIRLARQIAPCAEPGALAQPVLTPCPTPEKTMADRKDTFEQGKAALRDLKDSLTEGAEGVRDGVVQAADDAADTVESVTDTVRAHARRAAHAAGRGAAAARDDIGDAAADAADDIEDGIDSAQDAIEDGMDEAGDDLDDAFEAGKAAWAEATETVREVSRDALASAQDALGDAQEGIREYVRAKPLNALAIAGAAGFVLALLLRRRR
jgi:ElaB/YqjD/DUF883 family membrane-anchored ribosome-binding protein